MAFASVGMIGGNGCSASSSSWFQIGDRRNKNRCPAKDRVRFFCSASSSSSRSRSAYRKDPYKTLRIQPGASESEVRKAFRKLALQYHPDVCKGNNCGVKFTEIYEAYDIVMSRLRGEADESEMIRKKSHKPSDQGIYEPMRGMNDPDWELWEEWMGWEGAGIRDYSSHINPYI